MVYMHEEGFATKTLWSYYSMIAAYFISEMQIDPAVNCPSTRRLFKQWEKKEQTKQSQTFEYERITWFLETAANDGKTLSLKIIAILSLFGLLRKTEILALEWEHLDFSHNAMTVGKTMRKKRKGPMKWHPWIVSNVLCVNIIKIYTECFDVEVCNQSIYINNYY